MKTRYDLKDGYIEITELGNTYCGAKAHELMNSAYMIQRKTEAKFKGHKVNFNECLISLIEAYLEVELCKQVS